MPPKRKANLISANRVNSTTKRKANNNKNKNNNNNKNSNKNSNNNRTKNLNGASCPAEPWQDTVGVKAFTSVVRDFAREVLQTKTPDELMTFLPTFDGDQELHQTLFVDPAKGLRLVQSLTELILYLRDQFSAIADSFMQPIAGHASFLPKLTAMMTSFQEQHRHLLDSSSPEDAEQAILGMKEAVDTFMLWKSSILFVVEGNASFLMIAWTGAYASAAYVMEERVEKLKEWAVKIITTYVSTIPAEIIRLSAHGAAAKLEVLQAAQATQDFLTGIKLISNIRPLPDSTINALVKLQVLKDSRFTMMWVKDAAMKVQWQHAFNRPVGGAPQSLREMIEYQPAAVEQLYQYVSNTISQCVYPRLGIITQYAFPLFQKSLPWWAKSLLRVLVGLMLMWGMKLLRPHLVRVLGQAKCAGIAWCHSLLYRRQSHRDALEVLLHNTHKLHDTIQNREVVLRRSKRVKTTKMTK